MYGLHAVPIREGDKERCRWTTARNVTVVIRLSSLASIMMPANGGGWNLTGSVVVLMVAVTAENLAFTVIGDDLLYVVCPAPVCIANIRRSVGLLGCSRAGVHGTWRLICCAEASKRKVDIVDSN